MLPCGKELSEELSHSYSSSVVVETFTGDGNDYAFAVQGITLLVGMVEFAT